MRVLEAGNGAGSDGGLQRTTAQLHKCVSVKGFPGQACVWRRRKTADFAASLSPTPTLALRLPNAKPCVWSASAGELSPRLEQCQGLRGLMPTLPKALGVLIWVLVVWVLQCPPIQRVSPLLSFQLHFREQLIVSAASLHCLTILSVLGVSLRNFMSDSVL